MRKSILLCVCLFVLETATVVADENEQSLDQISFQVMVEREMDNDQINATLSAQAEDRQPDVLAETINQSMRWALDIAKHESGIKVRSGGYQTYPVYDDRKIVRWRGRQDLMLESDDVDRLSLLVGRLQEKLQVQSLRFSVSNQARRAAEDALIEDVLARFQARADLVVRGLGAKGYDIVSLSISTADQGYIPAPVPRQEMRSLAVSKASAPALEAGTSRVSVQAAGTIGLLR